ncbi:hypothetical protein [uncultured Clostridium sp.]|uniref:hypothetical protein n=1 Tax=uncultured Clostridium sp. TaxID=59620 RepID=UPI0032175C7F
MENVIKNKLYINNVDLVDKLENMYESEITEGVYEYIGNNKEIFNAIEKGVVDMIPEYDFENDIELYDCDEIYMRAIIKVLNKEKKIVTETQCGYGAIELI